MIEVRPNPPPWEHGVRYAVGFTEAIAGLCLTGFVVIVLVGMGGFSVLLTAWTGQRTIVPINQRPAWTVAWAATTAFGIRSFVFLVWRIEGAAPPVALSIAQGRLRVRPWLRPVVAAWWASLAAATVVSAHYVVDYLRSLVEDPTEWRYSVLVPAAVLFAGAVAANTNLLVATAAATGQLVAVRWVCLLRVLLDVGITVVLFRLHLPHVDPFTGRRHW